MFWKKKPPPSSREMVDTMPRHSHFQYKHREPTSAELAQDRDFEIALAAYRAKDYKSAFPLFEKLANSGHADGQHFLSNMYTDGLGVIRDLKKADELLASAAAQGNSKSASSLWYGHLCGINRPKNEELAAVWAKRLRELELREREIARGVPSASNPSPHVNAGTAISKLTNVDPTAMSLADCLTAEKRRDWSCAFAGAQFLADKGDAEAARTVYRYYLSGVGVFKDQEKAICYLVRAAELGSPAAQNSLAHRYMNGDGLERDSRKAYFWSILADANNFFGAKRNLERIELELSDYERQSIQNDASRWWEKNMRPAIRP